MARSIRRIVVDGYKSIRHADLDLGAVTVLVGANGAGKSNFIEALELLGRIADEGLQLEVGLRGGAQSMLYAGAKNSTRLRLRVESAEDSLSNVYEAVLVPAANDEMIFFEERLELRDESRWPHPIFHGIGSGNRESQLKEATRDRLSTGAVAAWHTLAVLRGCRAFHFQDTSRQAPAKLLGYATDNEALQPDAGNLAAFLLRLRDEHPASYRQILRTVQVVAPFFREFVLREEASGRVRLRWTQLGADIVFPAEALSDGTLRFICLAVLLLQPNPPALVVLDEPELGLHPAAIVILAEMLHAASTKSQVFLATQSVTLLDQFALTELVVADRTAEGTLLHRPEESKLEAWLAEYSLGDLWLKNLLGGRPKPEQV